MGMRPSSAAIRQFILEHVEQHAGDIVALTAQTFGVSRQAVHRHVQRLVREQVLHMQGTTRSRRYTLGLRVDWQQQYPLSADLKEDRLWRDDIRPVLGDLPANVIMLWQHGFTEMLNNAIEHSAGRHAVVSITQTALDTKMTIWDDGEGIFTKLTRELGLEDERHAVLELAKGKVTTDPAHHTGEGIFFTSRMFDWFSILSGNVAFSHMREHAEDWIGAQPQPQQGTGVFMELANTTSRTTKDIFDQFASEEDFAFSKTVVPVRLAQYGDEQLISRSQAKRLVAGLDRFKVVLLNFEGVDMIGQAFADEVFRVFLEAHPHIVLEATHVNTPIAHMIRHAAGQRGDALLGNGHN
jgi:anti-sigma regulatory factor (Ser/Thr protein kinase)